MVYLSQMKYRTMGTLNISRKVTNKGFTIVELAVVIVIIGILASLTVFGINNWQKSITERELRSEMLNVASAMKSKRNFSNAYPTALPDNYSKSANVSLSWGGGDGTMYCIDATSNRNSSITMFVTESGQPKFGTCAGGETIQGIGETWTARSASTVDSWQSITYGNGLFVAVASSDGVMTSPDGITWTDRFTTATLYSVTYGNGQFVAVGGSVVRTSPDGINWTSRINGPVGSNDWRSVTYANGMYVAVGINNAIMTSPDGITWTQRSSVQTAAWYSVTYGNGLFVATGGTNNLIITSPDGINWTSRNSALTVGISEVIYAKNLFVAVSNAPSTGGIMTSPDGITWTQRTNISPGRWYGIGFGSGKFVAVGQSGAVGVSSDGINWTPQTAAQANTWTDVAFGNGRFAAVSSNGTNRVMTSP